MDAGLIIAGSATVFLASMNRLTNAVRDKEESSVLHVLAIIMQLIGFFGIMWGVQ